jgi:hypothetical protein
MIKDIRNLLWTLVLLGSIFLLSCGSDVVDQSIGPASELDPSAVGSKDGAGTIPLQVENTPSVCTTTWKCISSSTKAYQLANCSFGDRVECPLGCINSSCKKADPCEVGFKCKNELEKGYQLEDCSWTSRTRCDYGCEKAECLPKSNASVVEPIVQPVTEIVAPPNQLRVGEVKNLTSGSLKIYLLEEGQVKLLLDTRRSGWLTEGDSYNFSSDISITVTSILFQPYAGGLNAIEYEIG